MKDKWDIAERDELVYEIIGWMQKWGLWSAHIFSDGVRFSYISQREAGEQSGWREWENVWVTPHCVLDLSEYSLDVSAGIVLFIECDAPLTDLMRRNLYFADYDLLPEAGQRKINQHMDLFETYVDWYEEYLEDGGPCFDDTEFDSYDEYWELESDCRERYRLKILKKQLIGYYDDIEPDYNRALAALILQELEEILERRGLRYWFADPYAADIVID